MRLLLLSGGLDSTALAYLIRPEICLTINYGQVCAAAEVRASEAIAAELGLSHEIIDIDLSSFGVGLLSGSEAVINGKQPEWWPYRNQMLVTLAAMKFANAGITEIIIGTVESDQAHCDGREAFINAMNSLLGVQEPFVKFSAPAANDTALQLLLRSKVPRDLLGWTFSCHVDSMGCGRCRGCTKHLETLAAFDEASTSK